MKSLIRLLQVIFLVLIPALCFSQQVISSAGASATGTGVQLSWTVGEPVISTFTGTSAILTQGFHQSKLTITSIEPVSLPGLEIKVYPNPTLNRLNIDIVSGEWNDLHLGLYDGNGKLLLFQPIRTTSETLNFDTYSPGLYFLKATRNSGEILQVFKVVKSGI